MTDVANEEMLQIEVKVSRVKTVDENCNCCGHAVTNTVEVGGSIESNRFAFSKGMDPHKLLNDKAAREKIAVDAGKAVRDMVEEYLLVWSRSEVQCGFSAGR